MKTTALVSTERHAELTLTDLMVGLPPARERRPPAGLARGETIARGLEACAIVSKRMQHFASLIGGD